MQRSISAARASRPIISVEALTRRFGELTAVDGATFAVERGEIFGLIGPNGAGKSTLIKMLTTLLPPTSGGAMVGGYDIVRAPASVRRHIGYVPQLLSADGSLTGYENMLLSARLYGVPRAARRERIPRALAMMGLSDVADRMVNHYSGGMLRRLEIAESMLHQPSVLFMDEPTVGLDPMAREAVWQHVMEIRRSFGTTMMITTHYMEEAERFCDRVALIAHGRIAAIGAPAALAASVGPGATLDAVFVQLVGESPESGEQAGYRDTRRARRAAREHA